MAEHSRTPVSYCVPVLLFSTLFFQFKVYGRKQEKCSSSVRSWGEREKDWLIKIRWDEELEFRQGNAKATVSDIRYVTTVMSPILGDRHTACTEKLVTTFKFLRSNSIRLLDDVRVYVVLISQ